MAFVEVVGDNPRSTKVDLSFVTERTRSAGLLENTMHFGHRLML